jgi:tripartite ATP-independent transporter DctQ subunit
MAEEDKDPPEAKPADEEKAGKAAADATEAAKPEAEAKEAAKPEAEAKEAAKPEAEAKEAAKPEAEAKEAAKPDASPVSEKPPASSPWPSSRKSEKPAPLAAPPTPEESDKAAWGAPFDKIDRAWTKLEARLCAAVLVAEILTLVFWISIRALSSTGRGGPGLIFRCLATALVVGVATHLATRNRTKRHELITTVAAGFGLLLGQAFRDAGVDYFANLFAWLQNSSLLVFFGGVNEIAKRLTLWLALLGASLATAQGKHINVDVVMRFLTPRARVPVAVLGWLAAAVVSIAASWGFFDYVAIEDLRAPSSVACPGDPTKHCPAPPGSKVDRVLDTTGRNLFLAGRQLSLDLRSLPRVIAGKPYGGWLTPHEWNEWLRGGGWEPRFKAEDVKAFELPEDGSIEFRNPSVTAIPGAPEPIAKLLVPILNLVFPFGLLAIGVRFLLRSLLAIAGWVKVDPAAAHGDAELAHVHDSSAEAEAIEQRIKEATR